MTTLSTWASLGSKQRIAIAAPVVLMATMFPIFRLLNSWSGDRMEEYPGWYPGPAVYWMAFLAKRTESVWWPMIAHFLGGIVMVS